MATNCGTTEQPFETNDEICQKLVEEFVQLTATDEALAQFYLQDRNWNLGLSVNDYFDHLSAQSKPTSTQNKRSFDAIAVDDSRDNDCDIVFDNRLTSSKIPKIETIGENSGSNQQKSCVELKEFQMICWNIDGIDEKNLRIRTEAVVKFIRTERAIIVFLQEVVPQSEAILRQSLSEYEFFSGNQNCVDYYTLTLINKNLVKLKTNEIIEFGDSSMGRNLLKTRVSVGSASVCLLNTHLESTKDFGEIRIKQLNQIFNEILQTESTETVIFGGDLNLRDHEVAKTNGIPNKVYDVWIRTGARKSVEYTWDLFRNDNLQFGGSTGKFKPRFRFDRVFVRPSIPAKLEAIHFGLIGLERLKPYVCFPSDHWGLNLHFSFI